MGSSEMIQFLGVIVESHALDVGNP